MKIINYTEKYLQNGRGLWVELTQHHRDLYNDQTIGGDNPDVKFDEHLEKVGKENIFFAELEGQIVGLVGLMKGSSASSWEVEPVVVLKAYRGQGIGKYLLQEIKKIAKTRGVKYLSIKPVLKNKDVVKFYYNSGFQSIGDVELFIDLSDKQTSSFDDKIDIFGMGFNY
jgi:GNAT superfamily N-acetyltransferase